jgi:hypothetical protein
MSKNINLNKNVKQHISQSESIFDEEEGTNYKIPGMVEEYENIEELHDNIQLPLVEGLTSEVPLEDFDDPQDKNSNSNLSKLENISKINDEESLEIEMDQKLDDIISTTISNEYDHFDDILAGNTSYSEILKEFDSAVAAINNGNLSLLNSKNLIDEMDETKDDLFLLIKDDLETKQLQDNIEIDLRKEQRSAESHEDKVPYKPLKEILTQKVVSSDL